MRRILSCGALLALLTTLITPPVQAAAHASELVAWTQVNELQPDTSYWETDRGTVRAGTIDGGVWRSLFQFDTRHLAGARIIKVGVYLVVDRTESCDETSVQLWNTGAIDPARPLTWRTSADLWRAQVATGAAQACGEFNTPLGFESDQITQVLQQAADDRSGSIGFGLRAQEEHNPAYGKAIVPKSVILAVDYNNAPSVPVVNTSYPRACGTADAPTIMPPPGQFSGGAKDLDDDNVSTTLEIRDAAGTAVHTSTVGPTASGSAFSWPELPVGLLKHGEKYSYRAKTSDGTDTGPYSTDCWFLVDSVRPGKPILSSTDYPNGQAVIPAGTTGTITLSPATPGDDVYGYQFGLRQDSATAFVKAGPDGRAVVPLTLPRDGTRTASFYARAVDRAGNSGDHARTWDAFARRAVTVQPHVGGDLNGDGRADVTFMQRHDFGRMTIWNATARDGGLHAGTQLYDTGITSGQDQWGPHVRGDFNGDGLSELVQFRRSGDNTRLILIQSDGNRLGAPPVPWSGALPLDRASFASGDFDGDGKTDVAAASGSRVLVFRGADLSAPTTWLEGVSGKIVAGDFDGDGKADLAEVRDENGATSVRTYASSGTAFGAGEVRWQGGDYRAADVTLVSADVDGDGRGDVVAASGTKLVVHTAADFAARTWWSGALTAPVFTAGDFDLDGKEDIAAVRAVDGKTQLWTWTSTGGGFGAPVLGWEDETRGTPAAS
ncbi:VCBS repeat-containing protein [Lentzea sp. NBC_00516]|uniref:FG-GAP repeat domain-containing protein n=1 Tax=Lentzea sp. NBC_00516 TaxID=2903582 RepID=UPI002E809C7F|nr:VCBS repeat-containing protein [Lentzea sp. NBC_00516]WUD28903.1 VCBS repeat-containing protein [Lentzea sp. NBC_00516]